MSPRCARWRSFVALCLLLVATPAAAQRFQVDVYSEADGLPSNQISRLAQAPDGRLWLATRGGTADYDGSTWRHHPGLNMVLGPSTLEVLFDEEGAAWAVGEGPRNVVARRGPGGEWNRLERVQSPGSAVDAEVAPGPVLAILEDQGALDLVWPDRDPRQLQLPVEGLGAVALEWHDGRFHALTRSGLYRVDPAQDPPRAEALDISGCAFPRGLVHDPARGELWVIGTDALHRVEGDALGRSMAYSGLGAGRTTGRVHGHFAGERTLYLGSWEGIVRLPLDGGEPLGLDRNSGLIADGANDILTDRAGNLWIATARGLSKVVSFEMASLDQSHGLPEDEVSAICPLPDGRFLLGHPQGLSLLEGGRPLQSWPLPFRGPATRVLDLEPMPGGEVVLAGSQAGLLRWDADEGVSRVEGPWGDRPVHSARVAADGRLRVITNQVHILGDDGRWREEALATRPGLDVVPNNYLRRILRGESGRLYLATGYRGALELDGDRWRPLGPLPPAPYSNCYTVVEEVPGRWLLGTIGGLVRVTRDRWEPVAVFGGERERPIYAILPVEGGWLLGHDNGVTLWDGRRAVFHRNVADGLAGNEVNRAGLVAGPRGEVYIGTDRGLTTMRPWLRRPAPEPPRPGVAWVEFGSERVPRRDGRFPLPRGAQPVAVGLELVELTREEDLRVRYRLPGMHEGWREVELGRRRVLDFPWLPAGEHALELQAATAPPAWSATVRAGVLAVPGPLWRSPWFLLLAVLALGVTVYVVSSLFAQRRYASRLGDEVRARTRELALSREHIASERQRLETTLGSISDGVLATDGDGRVAFLNPAAARILGRDPAEQLGRPLAGLLPVADLDGRLLPDATTSAREEGAFRLELGGRERALEISATPLRDGGAGVARGKVFALRDVTRARELESEARRAERLASLGVLAGGIAHDFNNLLAVVLGNLAMVRRDGDLVASGELEDAERAAERARGLTQQLLTFARGGAPVTREDDLASVVRESVRFVLSGSSVRAEIDLAPDLWTAFIDADQISQVLNNLLLNAQQAMPGGGRVEVRGRNVEAGPEPLADGPCVLLEVRDDGPGIPAEHRANIFDPYYTTKEGGSGLGLSSAYSIVARHGGLLTVDEARGQGCCFRVYLPATGRSERPDGPGRAAPGEGDGTSSLRILVMDDDVAVRRVMVSMLEAAGHEVEGAADGEEMLLLYRRALEAGQDYDVVVMDLTIPGGMGGKEAMAALLELDPHACGIVASGYSHDAVVAAPASYGFRGAVAKPFRPEDLEAVIAAAMDERRSRQGGTTR